MSRRMLVRTAIAVLASAALAVSAATPDQIQSALNAAHTKYKNLKEGKNADYIPALAKVDPNLFGIGSTLLGRFGTHAVDVEPSVSSLQLALARAGVPAAEAALLVVASMLLRRLRTSTPEPAEVPCQRSRRWPSDAT